MRRPFRTEQIHMVLTEEGIQLFEWTNLGEQEDEIAENTKLLSLMRIKQEMADHLLYRQWLMAARKPRRWGIGIVTL
ncbi:MAG: hypothetical protein ACLVJO_01290 [[Clostridium] scindens]